MKEFMVAIFFIYANYYKRNRNPNTNKKLKSIKYKPQTVKSINIAISFSPFIWNFD